MRFRKDQLGYVDPRVGILVQPGQNPVPASGLAARFPGQLPIIFSTISLVDPDHDRNGRGQQDSDGISYQHPWLSIDIHGNLWISWHAWISMDFHGYP